MEFARGNANIVIRLEAWRRGGEELIHRSLLTRHANI